MINLCLARVCGVSVDQLKMLLVRNTVCRFSNFRQHYFKMLAKVWGHHFGGRRTPEALSAVSSQAISPSSSMSQRAQRQQQQQQGGASTSSSDQVAKTSIASFSPAPAGSRTQTLSGSQKATGSFKPGGKNKH